jgi:Carboxypeptidase regulatory-like domain/TonB-dependent Receptor Plug Domain
MRLRFRSGRRFRRATLFAVPLAALIAAGWLAAPAPLAAQTTTSTVRGTVTGASGPVAGAAVEAVATETGLRRDTVTNARGEYALVGLPAGAYDLVVTADGMQPQARPVRVRVAQDAEVDFTLEPGEAFGETVEVIAPVQVETSTSEVATNVSQEQIELLPQNSRNFLGFANLAPGVRFNDDEDAAGKKFRGSGQDARQVNVFVDGLSYKNDLLQGGAFMQDSSRGNPFPQNAVQEFRVLTQNYKAEYEKASSAIITAVTKSGGNEHHGEVFYLFQDKGLVSQDDFSKDRGDDKPDYDRDQYGLSIGGPISRDSLHYFLSYEGNRQDRNATVFRGPSFGQAPADVQAFLGGFETGVLTSPFEEDLYFGKLSWQNDAGQSAFFTGHVRDEQEVRGYGGQRTRDGAESFEIGTDAFVGRHAWVLGDALN